MIKLSQIDCKQIVRNFQQNETSDEVHNFRLEVFGNFFGFLGEYYRLKIDVKNRELIFFVKSLPLENVTRREMLQSTGIFYKEIEIYRHILPQLSKFVTSKVPENNIWCPKALLIRDDLIIFNDLSHEGYRMLPFRFEFDRKHVKVTLMTFARFHASSIAYEYEGNSIEQNFGKILFETSIADIPWFHSGLKAIYNIARIKCEFGKSNPDLIANELYDKLLESVEMMEKLPISNVFKVLSHRDAWKNNLMFKFNHENDPTHCILVDFQTARYLPISIDVLMAIIMTTGRKHREENFEKYLKFYYDKLESCLKNLNINLKALMSFNDFTSTCDYHKRVMLIYRCISLMITMIPHEVHAKMSQEEIEKFSQTDKSDFVLSLMNEDVIYEKCLIGAVNDVLTNIFNCC